MRLALFVDFDGTVALEDVGNGFFRRFAGSAYDAILSSYREGRITAHECYRQGAEAVGCVDEAALEQFLGSQAIDESFCSFAAWCRRAAIPLAIVSDGLDFYIQALLRRFNVPEVAVYANTAVWTRDPNSGGMTLAVEYPYADPTDTRCAMSKRRILLSTTGDEHVIGYVGEGFSDFDPVQYADIVFAKDQLQTHCQRQNISYFPYRTFRDVEERLKAMVDRGQLHRRPAAERLRRKAFIVE